jgi:hypothetical protein
MGYLPEMNFSVFDLNERDLKIIQEKKPKLIADQLAVSPREALTAPKWILSNPENRRVVLEKGSGIGKLINDQGEISTRKEDWEKVIAQDWRNASLILYAPESLKNYEDRLLMYLSDNPKDFLKIRTSYIVLQIVQAPKYHIASLRFLNPVCDNDDSPLLNLIF